MRSIGHSVPANSFFFSPVAWDMTYSFWCLPMSKTWVQGVSGLQVDFGQVTLPSPHESPSIVVFMTAISSAKLYECYRLKSLSSNQSQHCSNFLTPLQQTLLLAVGAGRIYSVCSPCRRKWNKIKTLLSSRGGWGGNAKRKVTFVTKVLCDFSLALPLWKRFACSQLGRLALLILATAGAFW